MMLSSLLTLRNINLSYLYFFIKQFITAIENVKHIYVLFELLNTIFRFFFFGFSVAGVDRTMIRFYRFQSFFVYCCHCDIDFIGKSITWLVNSTLNCDWKLISHSASLRDSCDGFRVQFVNVEFPRQVMNFPIEVYAHTFEQYNSLLNTNV